METEGTLAFRLLSISNVSQIVTPYETPYPPIPHGITSRKKPLQKNRNSLQKRDVF